MWFSYMKKKWKRFSFLLFSGNFFLVLPHKHQSHVQARKLMSSRRKSLSYVSSFHLSLQSFSFCVIFSCFFRSSYFYTVFLSQNKTIVRLLYLYILHITPTLCYFTIKSQLWMILVKYEKKSHHLCNKSVDVVIDVLPVKVTNTQVDNWVTFLIFYCLYVRIISFSFYIDGF